MSPEELRDRLGREAEASGYHLNPDREFATDLASGLLVNAGRYGYMACPCRLASGDRSRDLDIICPCDYRDADLDEYGACYCALYVSAEIASGKAQAAPVPERRTPEPAERVRDSIELKNLALPVWRCKVCGYLCARENPPGTCPICKATRDRFERFI